ncbi:MAG: 1,4-dihydroxy-2-naphthoate octaprenyltransferase [Gemmatimonadaceae bacterium]|nr:1,4-dihydroxy-2-naphthoate octaprenyltransferase [Gemmatimonadaceae bacterium]NUR20722.1 1,4-dihydroxy-2-naphthoate octaprenyltransferase [Gemmatimonadaceae bacterium]
MSDINANQPPRPAPPTRAESYERISKALFDAKKVAVGTHAGEEVRVRMMHPGPFLPADTAQGGEVRPVVYLASMKTDPKIREMTSRPEVALLMHESPTGEEHTSWEMEVTGRAEVVKSAEERERAKEATKRTSSIVSYLDSVGQTDLLAFVRVTPRFIKHRVFGEIVAGRAPSILEYGDAGAATPDRRLLGNRLGLWKELVRWASLTASAASVAVGLAVAYATTGTVHWGFAVLTLAAAVALQACTNIKNDLDDQLSGADDRNRTPILGFTGGSRVVQRGLVTRGDMLVFMTLFGAVATVIGIALALMGRPWVIAWGVFGLAMGFVYTAGLKLANRGLGEFAVAIAFGVGIVSGTAYVQLGYVPTEAWAASVPVSLLVSLLLYINGFQDAASDAEVGKRTLVARLGLARAARLYPALAGVALALLVAFVASGTLPKAALLGLAGVPLFVRAASIARRKFDAPMELVPANAYTAIGHLASTLMLAVGLAWAGRSDRVAAALVATAVGALVISYYWRSVQRMTSAFYGVKAAVASR